MTSTAAVSIKVHANMITYFARQNLLEHGWRHALQLLQDEVPGLSTDQAIQIFKGEKCFINSVSGVSGSIDFVDDPEPSVWLGELAEAYGTTCKLERGYYRPYAFVEDYGPNDLPFDAGEFAVRYVSLEMQENSEAYPAVDRKTLPVRAKHYMANEHCRVAVCDLPIDGRMHTMSVLFEPADEPPYWNAALSPQQAVDAAIGEMLAVGFQDSYGTRDIATEQDMERIKHAGKMNLATSMKLRGAPEAARKLEEYLQASVENTPEHYEKRRQLIKIQNDAGGFGYRRVDFGVYGVRSVPNGPLLKWALNRGKAMEIGPEWEPVSMSGLKQAGDDAVHTDWITGAGLENEDTLAEPLKTMQDELQRAIQQEVLGLPVHVLVAGKSFAAGTVKYCTKDTPVDQDTIAIVANAGIRFEEIARTAAAVIALEGGATSHLAVNGLSAGYMILRDPDAKAKYKEGDFLTIDIHNSRVFKRAVDWEAETSAITPRR